MKWNWGGSEPQIYGVGVWVSQVWGHLSHMKGRLGIGARVKHHFLSEKNKIK